MLHYEGSLWLTDGARRWGGSDRVELLAQIGATGSITAAAKAVGMSYKGAWDAVEAMNNLAGEALVLRSAGGRGGGGATLTPRAQRLIASFRGIEAEHRRFVERLAVLGEDATQDLHLLRTFTMRTSARNQLAGIVRHIAEGAVNDTVDVELPGGTPLVATVTRESTASLGLAAGRAVVAMVKASWVILALADDELRLSAANRLPGTVSRVQPGAVHCEVTMALDGGGSMTAIVTRESAKALGLVEGLPVVAIFDASSVILGVTD
ncbi:TOBE domain-containing protein [Luteibacter yeojuensis]|uniref:TOBE domain-containing protein n=1 Tax=Luteibacter yeojuensis TaxID=345309 RepID=A0A7X5TQE0_9GAMM|nr:TOBE domain-containing protein [Luteibacter yeojuensis]NID16441.1 TOBE domain-containing protein [Luteibacter yeojuensis]